MHVLPPSRPAPDPPRWRAAGCGLGVADSRCGGEIVGAFAVTVAPDAWMLDDQYPGVLLLCRHHYAALNAPPSEDPCAEIPPVPLPP